MNTWVFRAVFKEYVAGVSCNVARVSCNITRNTCNITRNTCNMTTNSVPIVKSSQKQSNSKNDHWCTNRHMSTQSPPNTHSPRPPNTQSHFFTHGTQLVAAAAAAASTSFTDNSFSRGTKHLWHPRLRPLATWPSSDRFSRKSRNLYIQRPRRGDTFGISQWCLILGKLKWLGDHTLKKVWRNVDPFVTAAYKHAVLA